jgi:hypothetical protein
VEANAISGLPPSQYRVTLFVFGIIRELAKRAVDKLLSPYRMGRRLVQPSHVVRSFHMLHFNVLTPTQFNFIEAMNYLKYLVHTFNAIIRGFIRVKQGFPCQRGIFRVKEGFPVSKRDFPCQRGILSTPMSVLLTHEN